MFTPFDANLADLDFELVDELRQQQLLSNETMIKDLLSSSSPSSSNYRNTKPIHTTKRSGVEQLRRQLTDEGNNRQRTPPNSLGTSGSPLSSSYLSRLSSSNDNSPIRNTNAGRLLSTGSHGNPIGLSTTPSKQADSVTSLLKQAIAPAQLTQPVQTRLENPTKYHLEQMCRKQSLVADNAPTIVTQISQQDESSPDSEITSEMDDQFNDDTTCGSIDSTSCDINSRLSTTIGGDSSGAHFLSSSMSKDSLDSSSRHSSSCPTNILSAKAKIGLPLTEDEMRLVLRDRQKKDNHNMIERRRRFNINDRIKELGTLLPKGTELDLKQNKGTILRASVDYIKILRRQHENAVLVKDKYQSLAEENQLLQERVQELEKQCLYNGLTIQSPPNRNSQAVPMNPSHLIKQEPSSLSSSLSNAPSLLVPPSTPIFDRFDSLPTFDALASFPLVDEDSNEAGAANGNASNAHDDPLSSFANDPFLSSASFGFDNEMDIGGGFQ